MDRDGDSDWFRAWMSMHHINTVTVTQTASAGGRASIQSRVGSLEAPVEVTTDVMPGVVSLPFGWGYDEPGIQMAVASSRPGVNSNALTDDAPMDPLSGNAVLNGIPVEIQPA